MQNIQKDKFSSLYELISKTQPNIAQMTVLMHGKVVIRQSGITIRRMTVFM